jgi:mono/diheme cytochrome c family protein
MPPGDVWVIDDKVFGFMRSRTAPGTGDKLTGLFLLVGLAAAAPSCSEGYAAPTPAAPAPAPARPEGGSPGELAIGPEQEPWWSPIQTGFPFQASVVTAAYPKGNTANKSVSVRLGPGAAMNFDTDLLRMASGWTGAFLTPTGVTYDTSHGGHPQVAGDVQWGTNPTPGWADRRGRFEDPRKIPFGPLPEAHARWQGLTTAGDDVVLSYTVHGIAVDEHPSAITRDGRTGFVRTLSTGPLKTSLSMVLADVPDLVEPLTEGRAPRGQTDAQAISKAPLRLELSAPGRTTQVAVVGAPAGARLAMVDGTRAVLHLPRTGKPALFKIVLAALHPQDRAAFGPLHDGSPRMPAFRKGGAPHFPRPIITRGQPGTGPGPYVIDRLTTPFPGVYKGEPEGGVWKDNIYRRRLMIGGFDFFKDGKRAAVSTWEGDVWIVSGIDDTLGRLEWRRFASGLFEPLGLVIVNDVIHVNGRDQITRLHDLNGDGEADRYENFNNQVTNSPGFHEFQFDLQVDRQGNFYTAKASPVRAGGRGFGGGGGNGVITPMSGTLQKISKDGRRREVIATGLRAPNGIGVGPKGELTTGDNEGSWMPACPINWVRPGGFYGVEDVVQEKPMPPFARPLAWVAKSFDNSGGSQVWVPDDARWGPFAGQLLHLSYGRAAVYLVMKQRVGDGVMQGGIVRLAGGQDAAQLVGDGAKLTSSAMRARFNPRDGQLYVAGLSGWQSDAVNLTGFDRIRYTGKPVASLRDLSVTSAGVHLTFTQKLDAASVDPQNVSGERWNYRRSSAYGSPEYSVEDPTRRGHDRLDIYGAELSGDGRTVTLEIDDLKPVDQMLVKFRFKAEDGSAMTQSTMFTIHQVPQDPRGRKTTRVARRGDPGLVLSFATNKDRADARVVKNVALFVGKGRAPSAFMPPGPYEATWSGTLWPDLAGEHVFQADVAGALRIDVAGKTVLDHPAGAAGTVKSTAINLDNAGNAVRIVLRGDPARDQHVRLSWGRKPDVAEGQTAGEPLFEPIAPSALRHDPGPELQDATVRARGRGLFIESRCARCHLAETATKNAPELAADAPALDGIGARRNWHWLTEWILNPKDKRAGASMPRMLHGPTALEDARAIAAYLTTLDDGHERRQRDDHAKAVVKLAADKTGKSKGDALYDRYLCNGCHPDMSQPADDGRISLGHLGHKFPPGAVAAYLREPARHYRWNPMPSFALSDAEAVALEVSLTTGAWRPDLPALPKDRAVFERGRQLTLTRGCLTCHALGGAKNKMPLIDLGAGARGSGGNCAQGTGPADYNFLDEEKAAVAAFVAGGAKPATRHVPSEYVERKIPGLRCEGCHGAFDGFPALDNFGEKLRPEWMASFVAGRVPYKPRGLEHPDGHPWLPARMPIFAAQAALLAEGLAARAGHGPTTPAEPAIDRGAAKIGAKLVSANGGFSCTGCHGAGALKATQVFEAEGINLAYATDRLRPDFFRRWLLNPLKIDPQTKMPSYFDETGQSPLEDLGGRADAQINAMWMHLRELGEGKKTVAGQ